MWMVSKPVQGYIWAVYRRSTMVEASCNGIALNCGGVRLSEDSVTVPAYFTCVHNEARLGITT